MANCVDCGMAIGADEEPYSIASPSGFVCICQTCGAGYHSEDELFRRLREALKLSPSAGRGDPSRARKDGPGGSGSG